MSVINRRLKKIVENDGFIYQKDEFESKFILEIEESNLRKFSQKHIDTPLFKGAFTKCSAAGLISKYDRDRINKFYSDAAVCFLIFQGIGYLNYSILGMNDRYVFKHGYYRVFLLALFVPSVISGFYYFKVHKGLDRKYTPVWLNSRISTVVKK